MYSLCIMSVVTIDKQVCKVVNEITEARNNIKRYEATEVKGSDRFVDRTVEMYRLDIMPKLYHKLGALMYERLKTNVLPEQ